MNALLLKAGFAVAVLAGACAATWFAADAHFSQALASLEGQLKGEAAAQRQAVEKQKADDAAVAKGVDDEAKSQIGSMAAVIGDLSGRLQQHPGGSAIAVCAASAGPAVALVQPDRPAAAASNRPAAGAPLPTPDVGIDPAVLGDALTVAVDSLKAQQLWRRWARGVGSADQAAGPSRNSNGSAP